MTHEGQYSTGLCGCFSDIGICCYGCFCPCCLNMRTWARLNGEGCGCKHCCFHISPFWIRQTVKRRVHIEESCCGDCCVLCFCGECAICQDAREVSLGHAPPPITEYYKGQKPQYPPPIYQQPGFPPPPNGQPPFYPPPPPGQQPPFPPPPNGQQPPFPPPPNGQQPPFPPPPNGQQPPFPPPPNGQQPPFPPPPNGQQPLCEPGFPQPQIPTDQQEIVQEKKQEPELQNNDENEAPKEDNLISVDV